MAVEGYVRRFPFPSRGSQWQIMMREREWDVLQNDIPARSLARFRLLANDYCQAGPSQFDKTDFRFLGHEQHKGTKVRMEEFKAKQVRLFGFAAAIKGVTTFFVTGIDPAKKQQKADPTRLKAASKEAARIKQLLG